MINRNIFTDKPSKTEQALDYALAIIISICFTGLSLAWFDVLTY
jgi:hypothetical protein